jgi:hypothetical protein
MKSSHLSHYLSFLKTQPKAAAEILAAVERARSKPWLFDFAELMNAARWLLRTRGTSNEERWRDEVLRWATDCAKRELSLEDATEHLIRREIQESPLEDKEAARSVYVLTAGSSDCGSGLVRLAVFSDRESGEDMGCRDLTPREARTVAAALLKQASLAEENL